MAKRDAMRMNDFFLCLASVAALSAIGMSPIIHSS